MVFLVDNNITGEGVFQILSAPMNALNASKAFACGLKGARNILYWLHFNNSRHYRNDVHVFSGIVHSWE